jgi:hypothetical protein
MQANEIWIALFRRIPGDLHDNLSLGLITGADIVTQRIIRLEPEFMIVRGRPSGTTDPHRVIIIPYLQLTYLTITRELSEADMEAIFGLGDTPPVATILAASEKSAAASAPPEPATVNEAPVPVNTPPKKDAPSKTILLAKLRDRLNAPAKK